MKVKIKKLHEDAKIPTYGTTGAACYDLYSIEEVTIRSGEVAFIKTGLAFEIPVGKVMIYYPRSSFCIKKHLDVPHSAGIIDADFRGDVLIVFRNLGKEDAVIEKHEKIAQAMVIDFQKVDFEEVEELSDTERGTGGFGSTGKF